MSDTPLGVFEEQILLAVTRLDGSGHGMAVRRELERLTERDLAVGAVYATLDRLEAKGFVRSRRAMIDDGERRVFSTTASGARALASSRAVRERLWKGVNLRPLLGDAG